MDFLGFKSSSLSRPFRQSGTPRPRYAWNGDGVHLIGACMVDHYYISSSTLVSHATMVACFRCLQLDRYQSGLSLGDTYVGYSITTYRSHRGSPTKVDASKDGVYKASSSWTPNIAMAVAKVLSEKDPKYRWFIGWPLYVCPRFRRLRSPSCCCC
jgi:hypothetical protein